MAQADKVTSLHTQRHLVEQQAYEEIRHILSNQFVLDPVMFMQSHGKRPEDMNGQDLRTFYREAYPLGLEVRPTSTLGFKEKFQAGKFFKTV